MKEYKLEDIDPVTSLKQKLWQAIDIMRGSIRSDEYHIILYFLLLQRDKLLDGLMNSDQNTLKSQITHSILKYEGDNAEAYKLLYQVYEPTTNKLPDRGISTLINVLGSLNQPVLKEHFSELFDDLLYVIFESQGRNAGEYVQPLELSRFMVGLAELPKNAKVYNPFAGLGSFAVFLDQGQDYFGQEINQTTWAIGTLRIMAYERSGVSVLKLGNSINEWNPKSEKYDLVIANPPFNMLLRLDITENIGNNKTAEQFLIEKGISDLNDNGKLIVVVPIGFLFRAGADQNIRKHLIENDLLEKIISFPAGILINTGTPIAVLVIHKQKKEKGFVHFINAERFVENTSRREKKLNDYILNSVLNSQKESDAVRIVSNNNIKENDYNFNPPRYFNKQIDGFNMGNIVSIISGDNNVEVQLGQFVRIRDLKGDKLDFSLNLNDIEQVELPRQSKRISETCLLLAMRWRELKPTHFKYTGKPIYLSSDIIALKVDETKINLNYLINELYAEYINGQLESYRTGSAVPFIRKNDLLSIRIKIPSIEEQKAKVQGTLETLAEEKKKELLLFKTIHGLENEIIEQNTYLRHTLAGPTSNLTGSLNNIKKILADKIVPIFPEIMSLKVSSNHDITFGEYLKIIERDIIKISDAVSRQLKVETDIDSKKLTSIDIIEYFKKFVSEISDNKSYDFIINFDFDKAMFIDNNSEISNVYVLASVELLDDLFNNLKANAIAHAFSPGGYNQIQIFVTKYSQDELQILFSNSGKQFPENFSKSDFTRKGSKAGSNAGDGFGGWYINEIVKRFNGSLDIIDKSNSSVTNNIDLITSFEISIPIIKIDEDEKI